MSETDNEENSQTIEISIEKTDDTMSNNTMSDNTMTNNTISNITIPDNTNSREMNSREMNSRDMNSRDMNNENKIDSDANYGEWNALIDRSNSRYHIHTKSSTLWTIINHIFNISLIITSSIITADGIGDIFNKDILIILGLIMVALSSINTFLDPSSKYTQHREISKKYRLIYHQVRRCENFVNFLELQKQFEDTEQDAPDIPFFFSKKKTRVLFMNPNLQNDFNNYYRYQNEPQAVVVNTYAKMNV